LYQWYESSIKSLFGSLRYVDNGGPPMDYLLLCFRPSHSQYHALSLTGSHCCSCFSCASLSAEVLVTIGYNGGGFDSDAAGANNNNTIANDGLHQ
jgi:hypothetical protein